MAARQNHLQHSSMDREDTLMGIWRAWTASIRRAQPAAINSTRRKDRVATLAGPPCRPFRPGCSVRTCKAPSDLGADSHLHLSWQDAQRTACGAVCGRKAASREGALLVKQSAHAASRSDRLHPITLAGRKTRAEGCRGRERRARIRSWRP